MSALRSRVWHAVNVDDDVEVEVTLEAEGFASLEAALTWTLGQLDRRRLHLPEFTITAYEETEDDEETVTGAGWKVQIVAIEPATDEPMPT